jgi:hypothetical protein
MVLVVASGCGSDVEEVSPGATLATGQSVPTEQTSDSVPTGSVARTPLTDGSLAPGPNVDDLVSASMTDLVIVKPDGADDGLRAAILELGGEIHLDSDELGLFGARFKTESVPALAEIRDELRQRGFDASIDIESVDPTT